MVPDCLLIGKGRENAFVTMTNCNRLIICFLSALMLLVSCKKEKAADIHIEGRLLFSNTNPLPVTNYPMEIIQAPTIPLMNPSSVSSSFSITTNNEGYFECDFKDNTRHGYSSGSFTPIQLRGNGTPFLPYFSINNIIPGNMGDIYLYKKIDSVIISVDASIAISPSDTLQINYYAVNGFATKKKTGIKVTAGTTHNIIDTLINAVFTTFEYQPKTYTNNILITQTTKAQPYQVIFSANQDPTATIGPGDEKKRILNLR
jgi:hypothetical protein